MLKLLEMKKVSGMVNKKGYIPFIVGNKIVLLVKGEKQYRPKAELYI